MENIPVPAAHSQVAEGLMGVHQDWPSPTSEPVHQDRPGPTSEPGVINSFYSKKLRSDWSNTVKGEEPQAVL